MTRRLGPAVAAALAAAAPALGAEGGPIRSGEHDGFSRIVLRIDAETLWSLETVSGRATLFFPGKALDFGTGGVFDLIPRDRIAGVTSRIGEAGTTVELALACECRVSTFPVGGRYLALDVGDRDAVVPPVGTVAEPGAAAAEAVAEAAPSETAETAAARQQREAAAVASAEEILLQQIERAASQGIVDLSDGTDHPSGQRGAGAAESAAAPARAPEPPARPAPAGRIPEAATGHPAEALPERPPAPPAAASAAPAPPHPAEPGPLPPAPRPTATRPTATAPVALEPGEEALAGLAALLEGDQVLATTVFDRDRASATPRTPAEAPAPPECLPASDFAVADWSDRRPYQVQAAELSRRLVGEFDRPDPFILARRVQLDLRYGLGLEAAMLLDAFPGVLAEEALYRDLALAVEGDPLTPGGPLSRAAACPGPHGLWQAVGGATPVFRDPAHFAGVQAALAEVPADLRALIGPGLIGRLLDAGQPGAARLVYETVTRAPGPDSGPDSPALQLAAARLVAAEGNPAAALQALAGLADRAAPNGAEALVALARIAGQAALPLPDRLMTDLAAAALQARGTAADGEFRLLLADAEATRGALAPALARLRDGEAALPGDPRFPRLAAEILAAADPADVGAAGYARAVLDNLDLVPAGRDADAAREAVARRLLDLGLAPAARAAIAPALARGGAPARRLAAEALLRGGDARGALAALDGLDDPAAVALRAEAQAQDGAFDAAVTTLADDGRDAEAAAYAWPSGDWPRVRASDAPADRQGMASYMAARTGEAPAPPPAADPAALDGPAAFAEPVPSLADPSLDAARRLLATGAKVEDFVAGLLAPGGGAGAGAGAAAGADVSP